MNSRKWLRQARLMADKSQREVQHGAVFVDPVSERIVSGGCNLVPDAVSGLSNVELPATTVAIALAAQNGVSIRGCYLYTTESGCNVELAKVLMTCGVKAIYRHAMPRQSGVDEILDAANIYVDYYDKDIGEWSPSL